MQQALVTDPTEGVLEGVKSFAFHQVRDWGEQCVHFHQWERRELLEKEPSEKIVAFHGKLLDSLIKQTRGLISAAADSELFDDPLREKLSLFLKRLHISQSMFHSGMTSEEADRILAEVFPNGR